MKAMMSQLLDVLRSRVQLNLEVAHTNEKEIRQLLTEPLSNDRSQKLSKRFALSKRILEENKENLHIQNLIVSFLSKFKDVPNFDEEILTIKDFEQTISRAQDFQQKISMENIKPESIEEDLDNNTEVPVESIDKTAKNKQPDAVLLLTAKGDLKYNKSHPFYYDNKFFDKLLNHHIQREEYEICAQLVKLDRESK